MPTRRLVIALIIILTGDTLFATDAEREKWLLKSKRADLKTYTVISNDTYSTRLFVATDGKTKVAIARDDATGLTSISVDGKCQLFFCRRTSSGYSNVPYWEATS